MTIQPTFPTADLASLIGSRICHDLISPIGAINNGLELLVMSGDAKGPEMGLIGESVGSASARIRFFRIAFGAAGEQLVGPGEVSAILRDLYAGSRLNLNWAVETSQPRSIVRLCFLSILCLEVALPYGGTLDIDHNAKGWRLSGSADRINAADRLWGLLFGDPPDETLQPAHVQFAMLPLAANDLGLNLDAQIAANNVEIRF